MTHGAAGHGHEHGHAHAHEEFGAAYWEDRYGNSVGTGAQKVSPSLVTETAGIRPGRALDAGCGVGGDALWLALGGWEVTALDVSATALEQGRVAADAAGAEPAGRLTWVEGDLTVWEPEQRFDLVSSHYVHVPGPPEPLFARLASWVAPGGTLLVVGHDAGHPHAGAHPEGARIRVEQVVSVLPEAAWDVVVAEPRRHVLQRPGSDPVMLDDVVVCARRRSDVGTAEGARAGSGGAR